jgi:branched-chain amino acid transport system ATP-binding protein
MTALLQLRGLGRDFDGLRAVDAVDLDLAEGEVRALIGPNGAGKTTLVGMIAGRIAPSRGRVIFEGRDITRLPAHRRMRLGMAYTFQITSVFAGLSVAENVALAARRRVRGAALAEAVAAALGRVGLGDRAGQVAGDLAYGHQRLLEIAMGIAQRPRLLILDEPTQGLAEGEIEGFARLVRDLAGEVTILLIEHNMDVVMALAERITVMEAGRVLAEGTPAEIHANRAVQAAYLGGAGDAAAG